MSSDRWPRSSRSPARQRSGSRDVDSRRNESRPHHRSDTRGYATTSKPRHRGEDGSSQVRDGDSHSHTPSKWDRYRETDWKCMECLSWNSHRDEQCFRCERRPRDDPNSFSDHIDGFRAQSHDLDEFGRPKKRRKPDARWPPPFDKRSATYVFDARCGMFYHAISQFFFHPMTKLYYSNKEQKYYRHTPGEDSPFQPVEQDSKEEEHTPAPVQAKAAPSIAITLKTKTLPGSDFSGTKAAPLPTEKKAAPKQQARTHKMYSANMDRWSSRDTVKTKTGQPICPWCRRKFLDLPHLQRHEEHSAGHKINVAKWKERKDRDYRDRAWERRLLHGPEAPVLAVMEQSAAPAHVVLPRDTLGEGNIGNKMLQKLGWKSGNSLGRTGGAPNQLEKDWDRIESLARNAAGK